MSDNLMSWQQEIYDAIMRGDRIAVMLPRQWGLGVIRDRLAEELGVPVVTPTRKDAWHARHCDRVPYL